MNTVIPNASLFFLLALSWCRHVPTSIALSFASPAADVRTYSEVKLNYKDVPYAARIYGEKKEGVDPIVFSFGGYQHHRSSLPFIDRFAPKTQFCVIELPGTGDLLPLDHKEYSMDFLGECYSHAVKQLELGPVCVLAGSFAVIPAMFAVCRDPELASSLVLVGAPVSLSPKYDANMHKIIDTHEKDDLNGYADAVMDFLMKENDKVASSRVLSKILRRQVMRGSRVDHERAYQNTKRIMQHKISKSSVAYPTSVPSLFIFGEHDDFTRSSKIFPIAKEMENAHVAEMVGSDHLVHIERQNDFLDLFEDYFDGNMRHKTYDEINWLLNGPRKNQLLP